MLALSARADKDLAIAQNLVRKFLFWKRVVRASDELKKYN